jgi:hypothetical protein
MPDWACPEVVPVAGGLAIPRRRVALNGRPVPLLPAAEEPSHDVQACLLSICVRPPPSREGRELYSSPKEQSVRRITLRKIFLAFVAGHMAHPAAIPGALGGKYSGQDAHPVLPRLRTVGPFCVPNSRGAGPLTNDCSVVLYTEFPWRTLHRRRSPVPYPMEKLILRRGLNH